MNLSNNKKKDGRAPLQTLEASPGYFRLGLIVLDIPPETIQTVRVINNDEVQPLRAPYAMYVKTGQARWDVTISWTALAEEVDEDGTRDFSQWDDLRYILAMFKAAPFVEAENKHLRQVFAALDPSLTTVRLAFGLRQLKIDTHPDIPYGLTVTLVMTYFNYYPYTKDFGYRGAGGDKDAVDAYVSTEFKTYLDSWIAENLDTVRGEQLEGAFPASASWQDQIAGTLAMRWRRYISIRLDGEDGGIIAKKASFATPTRSSSPILPVKPKSTYVPADANSLIERLGAGAKQLQAQSGIPASVTVAQALLESSWGKSKLTQTANNWFGVKAKGSEPYVLMPTREQTSSGSVYMVNAKFRVYESLDDSLMSRAQFFSTKRYRPAMAVRNDPFAFAQAIQRCGYATDVAYSSKLINLIQRYNLTRFDDPSVAPPPPPMPELRVARAPVAPSTQAVMTPKQEADMNQELLAKVKAVMGDLQARGWVLDHFTESQAFFYQQNLIKLTDDTHGDEENGLSLFPEQFSILFVNQLAQIPLEAFQYPTYQHIGPASTMVGVTLKSNGLYLDENTDIAEQEPHHPGIMALNFMAHELEEQFQRLRSTWRSVDSIHRMQSVRVYNQVLNMLGISALMVKDVQTNTIPESPNAVQVGISASQYENMFESLGEYQVKGVADKYANAICETVTSDDFDKGLSTKEKSSIAYLLEIRSKWKNNDEAWVVDTILQMEKEQDALTKFANWLANEKTPPGTRAQVPGLAIALSQEERNYLLSGLKGNITGKPVYDAEGNVNLESITPPSQNWPGLDTRVKDIGSGDLNYADALILTRAMERGQVPNNPLLASINQKLAAAKGQGLPTVYNFAFKEMTLRDPALANQVNLVANSPTFNQKIKSMDDSSPGLANEGHGAYRDLGLKSLQLNGRDYSPAFYFVDYAKDMAEDMRRGMDKAFTAGAQANQAANSSNNPGSPSTTGFDANDQATMKLATRIPDYTMASAFPTFKLFLMEEDNSGTFYAFDDFYSYASVTDIEIIKYRTKPSLAIIQITNLAHLLSHKLFDDTLLGKYELSDYERFQKMGPTASNGGRALSGPGGTGFLGSEDNAGRNHAINEANRTEGYGPGHKEIPLPYFPLQPGTKIEIRMGFANNPDSLVRVFGGTVAELEGDQVITLKAEGFQAELMPSLNDKIHSGGRIGILHWFGDGPDFGGTYLWGDSGDTGSVMDKILKNSGARHFGHWQLGKPLNPTIAGFSWTRSTGTLLQTMGATRIGGLLATSYDRSGDNILINHVINMKGPPEENRGKRRFFDQTSWSDTAAYYYVPEDTKSAWDIIHDVSRRYPEYNLSVREFGFPYGCDATLVFAHPRDYYYTRPYNYDETRSESKRNEAAAPDFIDWWNNKGGRQMMLNAMDRSREAAPWLMRALNLVVWLPEFLAGRTESGVISRIDQGGVTAFVEVIDTAMNSYKMALGNIADKLVWEAFFNSGKYAQMQREFQVVARAWAGYRDLVGGVENALQQPYRHYHYVDPNAIIANNIAVNNDIYNAIRINGKQINANENIPEQYRRVLNVDDVVIDPKHNCDSHGLRTAYAQSFLREEIGKMYHGELIIRGRPGIEPYDVVYLSDPANGMSGPFEVDKVIHSFNPAQGYITILTPRCIVNINETSSKEWIDRLVQGATHFWDPLGRDLYREYKSATTGAQVVGGVQAAGALGGLGLVSAGLLKAGVIAHQQALALASAAESLTVSGEAAAVAGAATTGEAAAIPAFLLTPPGGVAAAVIAGVAVGAAAYVLIKNEGMNPMVVCPLMRFGKPWIGGLQGYEIGNFARHLGLGWSRFMAEEVYPTLLSFKVAQGYLGTTKL